MIKKIIRIFILLLIIFPLTINAENISSNYIPNYETYSAKTEITEVNDFTLFTNEQNTFGIKGTIKNNNNTPITYELLISYYDYENNLIYSQLSGGELNKESSKNIFISNNMYDINPDIHVSQIAYYSIELSTIEGTNEKYNYMISNYHIDIKVKNTNMYEVTEEITINYLEENQQFIKHIPLNYQDDLYKKIKMSKLMIDNTYNLKKEKDKYVLKIDGKNNKLEEKTYKISYNYIYGKDTNSELDTLYYILSGINEVPINNLSFKIELPSETKFTDLKLNLSNNTTPGTNITYTTNENTITGTYNKQIPANESLVLELNLDENYFINAKESNILNISIMIIIPTVSVMILFILWLIYGKDEKFTKNKQKNPPATLNSLEVGFLYRGKVTEMDIASLILKFANDGYLRIEEDKSDFGLIKSFELHKLKNYTGKNNKERIIFENIFTTKDIVTVEELDKYFYNAVNTVMNDLNHNDNKNKIFENTSMQKLIGTILTSITSFIIIFIPSIEYGTIENTLLTIFLISLYAMIYTALYSFAKDKMTKIIIIVLLLIHSLIYLSSTTLAITLLNELSFTLAFIYGLACIFLMILLIKMMPKRTAYGNKMLGKIVGYKNYLQNIKKDEIEERLKANPNYFYDNLPFTFVLGISNEWIKMFENVRMSKPKWTQDKTFHYGEFTIFITHSIHTLNKNIKNNR